MIPSAKASSRTPSAKASSRIPPAKASSRIDDWLLLQLSDSAFPTGGFAHSGGLEAQVQLGRVTNATELGAFLKESLWQAGHGALPFVRAAHASPERVAEVDAQAHAFFSNPIVNAASRTQGRAFVATCARVFPREDVTMLYERVRARRIEGHYAPHFGATMRALGVDGERAAALMLFTTARGISSAAMRLGVIGPHEANRMLHELAPTLDAVRAQCTALGLDDVAQPAPLLDLFGAMHDRLYSRLFQS